ncbi:MAG: PCMD domain-containing protein [Muribaculaceae bacterium]|nr:PCMD domain-containing protein [Muribaculaceae bacterium]
MLTIKRQALSCLTSIIALTAASEKVVPLRYGDMEHWTTRHIKESSVIGGKEKTLYEIGIDTVIEGNIPYRNLGGSPWGISNVMAKVAGVVKTNCCVYPDPHKGGRCVKMTTHIESLKVLGLVNINVLAAGSIFLGDMKEPITGTKDGPKSLNWGIPFTQRPKALRYDYKFYTPGTPNRIKQTGFSRKATVAGPDYGIAILLLQKRSEDSAGNITAKRVGTLVVKYSNSTPAWVDNATYEIHYGDITGTPGYDASLMGLRSVDFARNSKGVNVPVKETGWAAPDEKPTHMLLQFSSSHGGAFIGTPGNTLWIDNVRLVY